MQCKMNQTMISDSTIIDRYNQITNDESRIDEPSRGNCDSQVPESMERNTFSEVANCDSEDDHIEEIEHVRTWISENDEFYGRTDDSFILRFLRVSKFDVERTKKRIACSYNVRNSNKKWFLRSEENERMVEELINRKLIYVMNYAGNNKENIGIFNASACYPKTYSLDALLGTTCAQFVEIVSEDPRLQQHGVHLVGNASGLKWDMLLQATPMFLMRLISLLMPAAPVKIKGLHILNLPMIANQCLRVLKLIIGKKLRKRLVIHDDISSLHNYISPEHLPLELGGTAGPAQTFVDFTVQLYREGKTTNELNQNYGIGKHPKESVDNYSE